VVLTDVLTNRSFPVNVELSNASITLPLPYKGAVFRAVADANFTDYALFNYADFSWNSIIVELSGQPVYRIQLVLQSQFMLLQMGHLSPFVALESARVLSSAVFANYADLLSTYQTIYEGWFPISTLFRFDAGIYRIVQQELAGSAAAILNLVGYNRKPQEDPLVAQIRGNAFFWGAYYGQGSVVDFLLELFESGDAIPQAEKKAVYYAVVVYGAELGYLSVFDLYKSTFPSPDSDTLLFALSAAPNPSQCAYILKYLIADNGNFSIPQKLDLVSNILQYNLACRNTAWAVYQELAQSGFQKLGASLTPTIVSDLFGVFDTASDYKNLAAFISSYSQFFTPDQHNQLLTRIQVNQILTHA